MYPNKQFHEAHGPVSKEWIAGVASTDGVRRLRRAVSNHLSENMVGELWYPH